MKKVLGNVLAGVLGLYFLSLTVITPYYNWNYAKEHGFIKWLCLGEIVATLESIAWPYFVLTSRGPSVSSSLDERHYLNSKKACDEAMKIIVKVGDVARLGADEKAKVADLLALAVAEANEVQVSYLEKVHPEFRNIYEKNYKYAMTLLVQGLRTDNTPVLLAGTYGYNEFAQWMESHEKELSF